MIPAPAIDARGLCKTSGSLVAADDLDLTIRFGEVAAFLGLNGAGKSITLDMAPGLTLPDAGTIEFPGTSPDHAIQAGRAGVIFQDGGLLGNFIVGEALLDDVVDQASLGKLFTCKVSRCPGGEYQRLHLAPALSLNPDLLVMDEPTAGMDASARIAFWETMRTRTRRGHTVLFATYYPEETAFFADRIVIVAHGRLIVSDSVDKIRALSEGALVTATWPGLSKEPLRQCLAGCPAAGSTGHAVIHGEHTEPRTTDSDAITRWLLSVIPAGHLGIGATSLNKVFAIPTSDGSGETAS